MKLTISCAKCGRRLLLPPEVAGRTVQCPSCQGRFVAQAPPEQRAEVPGAEADLPLLVPVEEEPIPAARPASRPHADPVPVERVPERARPRRRRRGSRRPQGTVKARIVQDSLGKLSGNCSLVIFEDAVRLLGVYRDEVLFVPVPAQAEYLKDNRLAITAEGRRVELAVSAGVGPKAKLARDLAAFLRGERKELYPDNYRVPIFGLVFALAMFVPLWWMRDNLAWCGTYLGLGLLALLVAINTRWSVGLRVGLLAGLDLAAGFALAIGFFIGQLFHSLDGKWQPYDPPGSAYRVLMPGVPEISRHSFQGATFPVHKVDDSLHGRVFATAVIPADSVDIPLEQRFDLVRLDHFVGYKGTTTIERTRTIDLEGYPGREYVLDYRGGGKWVQRTYLVEGQAFCLLAGGRHYQADSPDLIKFLDSFEFKQPPATWQPVTKEANPVRQQTAGRFIRAVPVRGTQKVQAVALAPDGKRLAVGEGSKEAYQHLTLWDTNVRSIRAGFLNALPTRAVHAVAFSADGAWLAAGTDDGQVVVIDARQEKRAWTSRGHNVAVHALAFSPDGRTLASVGTNALCLWDVAEGKKRRQFPNNFGPGTGRPSLAFRPDGKTIATGFGDRRFAIRDASTGEEQDVRETTLPTEVVALAFTPDGKRLLVGHGSGNVVLCNERGEALPETVPHDQWRGVLHLSKLDSWGSRALALTPDGKVLVASCFDKVQFIEMASRKVMATFEGLGNVVDVSLDGAGTTLAVGVETGPTALYDISDLVKKAGEVTPAVDGPTITKPADKRQQKKLSLPDSTILAFAVAPDAQSLFTTDGKGELRRWDLVAGTSEVVLTNRPTRGAWLAFAGPTTLVIGGEDRATLWDVRMRKAIPGDTHVKRWSAVAPDGWLASADDKGLTLTALEKGDRLQAATLPGFGPVAFGSNGRLASRSYGLSVQVWDDTFKPLCVCEGHRRSVQQVAFSGGVLAGLGDDTTLIAWRMPAGVEAWRQTLPVRVSALAATPGENLFAVAGSDGHVNLFDALSGRARGRFPVGGGPISGLGFTPDGRSLAIVTGGSLTLWDVNALLQPGPLPLPHLTPARGRNVVDDLRQKGVAGLALETSARLFALSPDGTQLATLHAVDQTLRIWELGASTLRAVIPGQVQTINALAYSPDNKTLATADREGVIRLRDARTGLVRQTIALPRPDATLPSATGLAFGPTGSTLLVTTEKGGQLFDLSGVEPATLPVQVPANVPAVIFSADGKSVHFPTLNGARPRFDEKAWELEGRKMVSLRAGSFACSRTGSTVAWLQIGRLELIDAKTGQALAPLPGTETRRFLSVAMSPDGKWLATGETNRIELWDLAERRSRLVVPGQATPGVQFSADGKTLIGNLGDAVTFLDVDRSLSGVVVVDAGVKPRAVLKGDAGAVVQLACAPDGKHFAAVWLSREAMRSRLSLRLWDEAGRGLPIQGGGTTGLPREVFLADGGKTLALVTTKDVLLWEVGAQKDPVRVSLEERKLVTRFAALSPDGKQVAVASATQVLLVDAEGKPGRTIDPEGTIRAIFFSPRSDALTVLTDGTVPTLKSFDPATGQMTKRSPGTDTGKALPLSSAGGTIVFNSAGGLTVWEAATNTTRTFPATLLGGAVRAAAVTADGKRLALTDAEGRVTLWDLPAQKKLTTFRPHATPATRLLFTPDGKTLATGGMDVEVRLWDVATLEKQK